MIPETTVCRILVFMWAAGPLTSSKLCILPMQLRSECSADPACWDLREFSHLGGASRKAAAFWGLSVKGYNTGPCIWVQIVIVPVRVLDVKLHSLSEALRDKDGCEWLGRIPWHPIKQNLGP